MKRLLAILILAACVPAPDPVALRALFDAEQVDRLDVPVVFLTGADVALALVPIAQNARAQTWQSRDAVQVSERGGVLIATRGLGHDLMAADVAGLIAALEGRGAAYMRDWVHLDGQLQLVTRSERCSMAAERTKQHRAPLEAVTVTVFVETCGADDPIINRYHVARDGVVWWSRQWVSAQIGMIELERIAR